MMRSLLKKLIIPVLSSRPISGIATRIFGSGIPIFMLHSMSADVPPEYGCTQDYLRRCLRYLKRNGYQFVSVDDVLTSLRGETYLPEKSVAFTIDDGFYDQASLIAPVFIEFDCPATIFLISGFLDGDLWPWYSKVEYIIRNSRSDAIDFNALGKKERYLLRGRKNNLHACHSILGILKTMDGDSIPETIDYLAQVTRVKLPAEPPDNFKPMTWSMARELEKSGLKFGPHTVSHPILSRVTDQQSRFEITSSWQRLKDELSSPSRVFCYPNGRPCDFGNREIEIIRNNGFLGAVSTIPAQVKSNFSDKNYLFSLPRYPLPSLYPDFIKYCTWIEYAAERIRGD